MAVDYSLLRTVHRILKQKSDLNGRIERGPRQVAVAENAQRQFAQNIEQVREVRKKTRMMADEKQLQLVTREARIVDLKGKLNAAVSNREFQLLRDQIAADEQANSVLSDEILEMLERLDILDAEFRTAEENLGKAKQETERVRQRVNAELESLAGQLESVTAELQQNEAKMVGDYTAEYRRLVARRGEEALAETDMETCGHCSTRITTQAMNELMLKKPVFCQSCGCLMYVAENHAAVN